MLRAIDSGGRCKSRSLLLLALAQALQGRVAVPDVLAAEAPFAGARPVAGAGGTVPGAVGVPGQAALRTGAAICLALVQLQPGHAQPRAHVQHLPFDGDLHLSDGCWHLKHLELFQKYFLRLCRAPPLEGNDLEHGP